MRFVVAANFRAWPRMAALALWLASGSSNAAPIAVDGPVTITADSAEWNGELMVYTGAVVMSNKSLEMKGDRLEFKQPGGRNAPFSIQLTGKPATLHHDGAGREDPPVSAQGQVVNYFSATQEVELTGGARLTRGKDELTGESVRYNTAARSVKAAGGAKGGRVKIVIDVPAAQQEMDSRKNKATDRPGAAP